MTLLGRVLLHVRAGLWTMQEMASGCGPELIESTRGAVAARRFPNIVGAGGMAFAALFPCKYPPIPLTSVPGQQVSLFS